MTGNSIGIKLSVNVTAFLTHVSGCKMYSVGHLAPLKRIICNPIYLVD